MNISTLLFAPATAVMNRMRYGFKFACIGAAFALPLVGVGWLLYRSVDERIVFNAKEVRGVVHLVPAHALAKAVAAHGIASVDVITGKGDAARKEAAAKMVAQVVSEMDAAVTTHGEEMKTTASWPPLRARIATLLGAKMSDVDALVVRSEHDGILTAIAGMSVNDIGNYSNLILDPDLDSYWLMDAQIIKVPDLTAKIASLYGLMSATAKNLSLSTDKRIEIVGLAGTVRATVDALMAQNIKTFDDEMGKKGFAERAKKVDAAVADAVGALRLAAGHVDALLVSIDDMDATSADAFLATMSADLAKANEALSVASAAMMPELRDLCQTRVDGYEKTLRDGAVIGAVALLIVSYLFMALYNAIRGQVAFIQRTAKAISDGQQGTVVDAEGKPMAIKAQSKDEIADIVASIDGINRTVVEARELRRKVEADNADTQKTIQALGEVLLRVADNDFTVRAEVTEGTMGMVASALNMTIESLVETIGEATKVAQQAADAAARITEQAAKQGEDAERTTQEAAIAGDTVKAIVDGLKDVASKAGVAAATAGRAREQADSGADTVNKMVGGMDDLSESVASTSKKIKALGDRSMEIVGMVGAIAKISERTSLLALNASIEAARAGEHGRGFSVVADNVKDLSEKAQSTTGDIDKLAKQIQVETTDGVSAMEDQTANVANGVKMAGDAGKALDAIKQSANQSADVVGEIAGIANEQTAGAGRAIEAMDGLRQTAESGAARARETIQSASELAAVAQTLKDRLSVFKIA